MAAAVLAQAPALAQIQAAKAPARAALATPVVSTAVMPSRTERTQGTVQVVVRLADQPLALAVGPNAKRVGSSMTLDQRRAYMAMLKAAGLDHAKQFVAVTGAGVWFTRTT